MISHDLAQAVQLTEGKVRAMAEGKKLLKMTGITLAVYFALKYLLPYVVPFLIAIILVRLLDPLAGRIQRRLHLKKEVVAAGLMAVAVVLLGSGFYWLYRVLMEQIRKIAGNFDLYYSGFCGVIEECCEMAGRSCGGPSEDLEELIYAGIDHAASQIRVYLVPGVVNYSFRYLKKLADAGVFLLMIFVSAVLLMKDYDEMKRKLQKYDWYQKCRRIVGRMWKQGGMYLKAQGIIIGIVTLLCTGGLWLLGNPYFLLLGMVIGLTDALPFIGTGTLLIPIAVYLIFQRKYQLALGYGALFLVTYVAREFLEPKLIGGKLGIYPFVMVAVVYAGLYLYGPAGVALGPVSLLLILEIWGECERG